VRADGISQMTSQPGDALGVTPEQWNGRIKLSATFHPYSTCPSQEVPANEGDRF